MVLLVAKLVNFNVTCQLKNTCRKNNTYFFPHVTVSDDVVDVLKALSEQHALAPNSSAGSIPRLSREGSLQSEGPELLSSPNISHVL